MSRVAALVALALCTAVPVQAQTAAVELAQSVGTSSEGIDAAATQVRASGEPARGLRLSAELAWGTRSRDGSDVFGTAYPYDRALRPIEVWADYAPPPGLGLRAIRAGRYRTPFGMAAASDHAYLGFLRPPLVRYGGYFALSNGYLEHGVDVVAGVPRLSLEASVGRPGDVGTAQRRPGWTSVLRAQGAAGPFVIGVSAIDTMPYQPVTFAKGRARFAGLDARWMAHGVQLRGEWLGGRPFTGTSTTGGYLDLLVHVPGMGPVTALARVERLDYDTANTRFALHTQRVATGARVRVWRGLSLAVNAVHQTGQQTQRARTAIEAGVTLAMRKDHEPQP